MSEKADAWVAMMNRRVARMKARGMTGAGVHAMLFGETWGHELGAEGLAFFIEAQHEIHGGQAGRDAWEFVYRSPAQIEPGE
jgi:hypothetical protein